MFYINLLTKQYIDETAVVKESNDGLTYYENGCWKYLPAGKYQKTEAEKYTYTIGESEKGNEVDKAAEADTDITQSHVFYTNYFGLSKLELSQRKYRANSGMLTADMNVTPNKPLKLLAEMKTPEKTSIEFFIVDGNKEVPILPQGETNVVHERVFFGTEPRFKSEKYAYYKDFAGIGSKISENDLKLSESLFTVCYAPVEDAFTYTPSHTTVKVKAVLRMYDDNAEPPAINSIVLSQEV